MPDDETKEVLTPDFKPKDPGKAFHACDVCGGWMGKAEKLGYPVHAHLAVQISPHGIILICDKPECQKAFYDHVRTKFEACNLAEALGPKEPK